MAAAFGWRSWARTVGITAGVTSAFWVILGGWFYSRHLEQDRAAAVQGPAATSQPSGRAAASSAAAPVPFRAANRPLPSGLVVPVAGVSPQQLTDTFTQAREQGARRHDAIDIMAPEGTPVIAAAPGRVEKLFLSEDGGNTVYVRSNDGRTLYYYAHLRDYAPGLAEGARIERGAALGTVGHTGNADPSGPHLHFAVIATEPARAWHEDGEALNPYPLLGGRSAPASPKPLETPKPPATKAAAHK